jgi:hypothetical protein
MLVTPMAHSHSSFLAGRSGQFFSLQPFFRVEFQPFGQLHAQAAETGKNSFYRRAAAGRAMLFLFVLWPLDDLKFLPTIPAREFKNGHKHSPLQISPSFFSLLKFGINVKDKDQSWIKVFAL